jgi:hypothetical protein
MYFTKPQEQLNPGSKSGDKDIVLPLEDVDSFLPFLIFRSKELSRMGRAG